MPFGSPSSAGTSNDSIARTNRISSVATIAGQVSLRVTRHTTWRMFAPLIVADSSNDGSIARNAAVISRNAIGE